jgi:ribonucleoside-diphosphate reductase alpha chain
VQYDTTINDWHTCPNSGRINASNPCSEYMFLDDTACNLASINLLQFFDADARRFDLEGYEHAINLWTIVLEISVLMAAFPSEEIARQSYRFRTLGLGYANLGAMLMQAGIPYDSEDARAICGAVSAILTGRSYAMSAQMAGELTPFPGFARNREAMMRVIRNHRRAAYGVPRDSDAYETLSIKPVPIDHERFKTGRMNLSNAEDVLSRAKVSWDEALEYGQRHGFRNAQVTVIAPTGTIGLLMDCDTTGVEPDFALVKFKKLAGGGYFKIANASLRPALKSLGYDNRQTDEIVTYVMGTLSIDTPMPASLQSGSRTFRDYLDSRGFSSAELVAIENQLPTVFELAFAFSAWSMPERVLKSIGVDPEKAKSDPSFNGLKALGLTARQIEELNRLICGTQCIEGAPYMKSEHLAVFDCANKCGSSGQRFIAPQGHIRMMAAAQPFISGAISKTINLPEEASVEDIGNAYWLSWELGLKANALYRDGSKLSQPLNTKSDVDVDDDSDEDEHELEAALGEASTGVAELASAISTSLTSSVHPTKELNGNVTRSDAQNTPAETIPQAYIERIVERIIERPMRRRLPDTRRSITHHFNVAGHEGYLTVGQYDDGSPGELFITMSKEGSTIGGLMDSLGTAISVALQYGVPIESLVTKFAHQRFEPMGMTTNRDIPFAKSLVDYIFRWMGMEFIPGYREANAPPRTQGSTKSADTPSHATPHAGDTRSVSVKEDKQWSEIESLQTSFKNGHSHTAGANGSADLNRMTGQNAPPAKTNESNDTAKTDATISNGAPNGRTNPTHPHISAASMIVETHSVVDRSVKIVAESAGTLLLNPLDQSTASLMGDAPACDGCGSITVRNGSCYKCMNCGNSMGCS